MDAVSTLCCLHTCMNTKPSICFLLERECNESLLVVYRYIDGSHVKCFFKIDTFLYKRKCINKICKLEC